MARNATPIDAAPGDVYAVITEARTYDQWVVGCQQIREVDDDWPAPGSRFHHRVGVGPITVADYTEVLALEPGREVVLRARARPLLSAAKVTFILEPDGPATHVVMLEGPLDHATRKLWNPIVDKVTKVRNVETLRRLKSIVERARP